MAVNRHRHHRDADVAYRHQQPSLYLQNSCGGIGAIAPLDLCAARINGGASKHRGVARRAA